MFKNLVVFVLLLAFVSCFSLIDQNNIIIKTSSNNLHSKKAVLFLCESGATVPDSYQVTVADSDDNLYKDEIGNTFIVDANHDKTNLDSTSINFTWLSNNKLQIEYNKKLRTFIQKTNVDGVAIVYQSK